MITCDASSASFDSTTYGINRCSPLNSLTYFHVCDYGLPPDVMHDLLEGYLPYCLKLMLSHFISTLKLFTLDLLNLAIANMDYGYAKTSRPQCLTDAALSTSNGCTTFPLSGKYYLLVIVCMFYNISPTSIATETWSLCRLLPVMVGHKIPEDNMHWLHYLELLEILDIVCAPIVHKNTPALLQMIIESNVTSFVSLYPTASVIPKIHYLLHLPRYIEKLVF